MAAESGGGELATVELRSERGTLAAGFVPEAGMVCCSLRHRGEELLAGEGTPSQLLRDGTLLGVPLLHPWANRLVPETFAFGGRVARLDGLERHVARDTSGLAIHGLIAPRGAWSVQDVTERRLRASLEFPPDPALAAAFPFPHRVGLEAAIGEDRLAFAIELVPTGGAAVPVAFGFHPYLRLGDDGGEGWTLALPAMRRVELDARRLPAGRGPALAAGSVRLDPAETLDEGYVEVPDGAGFALIGAGRRVEVRMLGGFPAAQVYAPTGEGFVCFEPMTAPANALVTGHGLRAVAPGDAFRARFAIVVTTPEQRAGHRRTAVGATLPQEVP